MTDLIILGMLFDGPQHGYRLKQNAGVIFGHGELHNNLVYPLLRRFMANKWVTKKTVPGERGQNRQQYAITALGRQRLVDRIREFSEQDARSKDHLRARRFFRERRLRMTGSEFCACAKTRCAPASKLSAACRMLWNSATTPARSSPSCANKPKSNWPGSHAFARGMQRTNLSDPDNGGCS